LRYKFLRYLFYHFIILNLSRKFFSKTGIRKN